VLLLSRDNGSVLQLVLFLRLLLDFGFTLVDLGSSVSELFLLRVDLEVSIVKDILEKIAHNLLLVGSVEALFGQCILLSLQSFESGLDIGIDKVGNVLAVVNLGNDIVLPRIVGEDVIF
jgi:hypothetical protein